MKNFKKYYLTIHFPALQISGQVIPPGTATTEVWGVSPLDACVWAAAVRIVRCESLSQSSFPGIKGVFNKL